MKNALIQLLRSTTTKHRQGEKNSITDSGRESLVCNYANNYYGDQLCKISCDSSGTTFPGER